MDTTRAHGLMLGFGLILAACGGPQGPGPSPTPTTAPTATAQATPTATAPATATPTRVRTPTPVPTPTAVVASPTAAPSPTAVPTPAPGPNLGGPYPYARLSEYGFYREPMAALEPRVGVVPYSVVSPLWTDGALKDRFIVLPPGETAQLMPEAAWVWPVGTILVKSFSFPLDQRDPTGPRQIIETRLLIHDTADTWTAHTYVWNAAQTDADMVEAGKRVVVSMTGPDGAPVQQTYLVPNTNQCGNCHEVSDVFRLLGPVTEQLNATVERDGASVNQIEWLASQGVLSEAPPDPQTLRALIDPMGDGPLDWRARSYLHSNCAHCHQDGGGAGKSGLYLSAFVEDPQAYGVCKPPVAAGGGAGDDQFDIVPGSSETSIMIYRMSSVDPDEKMPEVGNLTVDWAGVEVVSAWIDAMPPVDCTTWGSGSVRLAQPAVHPVVP